MEKFNRIELKYLVDYSTFEKFLSEIKNYIELDEYNYNNEFYSIYNIYYDTATHYFIRHGMIHKDYKTKIRLRSYNKFDVKSDIFIEQKEKKNGVVYKHRSIVEPQDISNLHTNLTLNEQKLYPKCFIGYDRLAFFSKEDKELRITFDFNITGCAIADDGMFFNLDGDKIILTEKIVLEVKTNNGLPHWLIQSLAQYRIHSKNYSKYGQWYKKEK